MILIKFSIKMEFQVLNFGIIHSNLPLVKYFNFKLFGDFCFRICSFRFKWKCFFRSRSFSVLRWISFFFNFWQKSAALSKIINFEALSESASSGTQNFNPSKAFFRSTLRCLSMELWRSLTSRTSLFFAAPRLLLLSLDVSPLCK